MMIVPVGAAPASVEPRTSRPDRGRTRESRQRRTHPAHAGDGARALPRGQALTSVQSRDRPPRPAVAELSGSQGLTPPDSASRGRRVVPGAERPRRVVGSLAILDAWRRRGASGSCSRSPAARSRSPTRARSTSPRPAITKLDVVRYYLAVAEGALRGAGGRPNVLVRYADGIDGEFFYQKRAPDARPDWIEVVALSFPSGRTARGGRAARRGRARLDGEPRLPRAAPAPGARRRPRASRRAARRSRPGAGRRVGRSSGRGRGRARRCSPTSASSAGRRPRARAASTSTCASSAAGRSPRCGARRSPSRARSSGARPTLATSKWWKEERHGVFLDYNQNAKDRTVAGAYSVRPTPDARVSAPRRRGTSSPTCEPEDFTLRTMPARFAAIGDRHAGIDEQPGLARARCSSSRRAQEAEGLGDAPWPPHYAKQAGEPPRVAPVARRRREPAAERPAARLDEAARSRSAAPRTEGRRARRARALEGAPSRGRRAPAARRRARRRDARPLLDLDAHPREPASTCPRRCGRRRSRSIPTTIPGAGATGTREPRAPKIVARARRAGVTSSWS